ncbi:hypothetical protein B0H11DRAFT_1877549, partial [Mycena galericulata]
GSEDKTVQLWDADTVALDDLSEGLIHPYLSTSGSIVSNSQSSQIRHLDGGWACSSSRELLLWLPTTNREGVQTQHTKLVIGRKQTQLSFENSVHGTEWKNCYIGQ